MLNIYKASAGSGKTYQLTFRYLRQLLGEQRPPGSPGGGAWRLAPNPDGGRHAAILAITFTNMATEEMKRRILHELALLAGMEPNYRGESAHLKRLVADLHTTPDALRRAAARALTCLLWNYRDFHIHTIDSFFQNVLRTFAHEAELTGDYEIDLEKRTSLVYAVDRLFEQATTPGEHDGARLQKWLRDYMEAKLNDGHGFLVFNRKAQPFNDMVEYIQGVTGNVFEEHRDRIIGWLSRPDALDRFIRGLVDCREAACRDLHDSAVRAAGMIDQPNVKAKSYLRNGLRKVIDYVPGRDEKFNLGTTIPKVAADPSQGFNQGSRHTPETADAVGECCRRIPDCLSRIATIKVVFANLYLLGLLDRVLDNIKEFRSTTSTLLLEDTNALLRRIIGDDEAPFVYERTSMFLHHFLIDEFQDTSPAQWANLRPLLLNGLADGHESFVIGDEKQCIYRFRDSDPELLHSLHRDMGAFYDDEGAAARADTNWRSSADIVTFNNTLFAALARTMADTLDGIYDGVEQEVSPKHASHRGFISVNAVAKDAAEEGFENCYLHMYRQLTQGGYRPCDLAVLTRANKEASAFIDWFNRRVDTDDDEGRRRAFGGVRLLSDNALKVKSSGAVRMIVSFMRYLCGRQRGTAEPAARSGRADFARIARVQYRLEQLCSDGALSRGAALSQALHELHQTDADGVDALPGDDGATARATDCSTLPGLVQRICSCILTDRQRREEAPYITAFHDLVVDQCAMYPMSTADFLRWWDKEGSGATISGAHDRDAIRVLTIHKAKGLEFECLHIPCLPTSEQDTATQWVDCDGLAEALGMAPGDVPPMLPLKITAHLAGGPFGHVYDQHRKKCDIDRLNLLYVALTRAKCELIVNFGPGNSGTLAALMNAGLDAAYPGHANPLVIGSPTRRADSPDHQAGDGGGEGRKCLDPDNRLARPMPDYSTGASVDIWGSTSVNRDDCITSDHDLCRMALLTTTSPDRIGLLLPASRRALLEPRLRAFLAAHPEWYDHSVRSLDNHHIMDSEGHAFACDRIAWAPDGSVHVIAYRRTPGVVADDEQRKSLDVRVSIMRRLSPAGTRVEGHLPDIPAL